MGLGAYFVLILAIHGISPFAALPVAAIGCGVAALPLWWLVSRLRTGYFAIATWVLAATVMLIIERFSSIGGGTGLPLPGLYRLDPTLLTAYTYWVGLAVTVLALAAVYLLLRGRLGLVLTAIRDDEVAARSSGARVGLARMLVFVVAADRLRRGRRRCWRSASCRCSRHARVQRAVDRQDGVRGDHRRPRHDRGPDPRHHRVHGAAADAAVVQRLVPDHPRPGGHRRRAVRAARPVGTDATITCTSGCSRSDTGYGRRRPPAAGDPAGAGSARAAQAHPASP